MLLSLSFPSYPLILYISLNSVTFCISVSLLIFICVHSFVFLTEDFIISIVPLFIFNAIHFSSLFKPTIESLLWTYFFSCTFQAQDIHFILFIPLFCCVRVWKNPSFFLSILYTYWGHYYHLPILQFFEYIYSKCLSFYWLNSILITHSSDWCSF
jgi:hypothetical protein